MSISFFETIRYISSPTDQLAVSCVKRAHGLSDAQKREMLKDTQFIAKIIPIIAVLLHSYHYGLKEMPANKIEIKLRKLVVEGVNTIFKGTPISERFLIVCKVCAITEVIINIINCAIIEVKLNIIISNNKKISQSPYSNIFPETIRYISNSTDQLATSCVKRAQGLSDAQKREMLKDTQFIAKLIPIIAILLHSYYYGLKEIPAENIETKLRKFSVEGVNAIFKDTPISERFLIVSKVCAITEVIINIISPNKKISQSPSSKL